MWLKQWKNIPIFYVSFKFLLYMLMFKTLYHFIIWIYYQNFKLWYMYYFFVFKYFFKYIHVYLQKDNILFQHCQIVISLCWSILDNVLLCYSVSLPFFSDVQRKGLVLIQMLCEPSILNTFDLCSRLIKVITQTMENYQSHVGLLKEV